MSGDKKEESLDSKVSVEDFINDPKAQAVALSSAQTIVDNCGSKWFDIFSVTTKFNIGLAEAIMKLEALKLFGFIHEKMEPGKEKLYKVTLSNASKLKLFENDIKFYQKKIELIKMEIGRIKDKISKAES